MWALSLVSGARRRCLKGAHCALSPFNRVVNKACQPCGVNTWSDGGTQTSCTPCQDTYVRSGMPHTLFSGSFQRHSPPRVCRPPQWGPHLLLRVWLPRALLVTPTTSVPRPCATTKSAVPLTASLGNATQVACASPTLGKRVRPPEDVCRACAATTSAVPQRASRELATRVARASSKRVVPALLTPAPRASATAITAAAPASAALGAVITKACAKPQALTSHPPLQPHHRTTRTAHMALAAPSHTAQVAPRHHQAAPRSAAPLVVL